jgi:DNA primase
MAVRVRDLDLRLAVTDSPLGDMPEKIPCPVHTDPSASLAIYPGAIHCFGCGLHSTGYFALALLLYGHRDAESVRRAVEVGEKYTARSLDAYRARVETQVKLEPLNRSIASVYKINLYNARSNRLQWLYDRGLTDESIDRFNLGHDGTRFTIPIYSREGDLLTIRFRRDDFYGTTEFDPRRGEDRPLPKYSGLRGRNGLFLFGAEDVEIAQPKTLVVVEGELDAIRLWQEDIPAVSATNGAGAVAKLPALIREQFPQIDTLEFCCDQDTPGKEAAALGLAAARSLGFEASYWGWPEEWGCKDITEVLRTHSLEETGWMQVPSPA